MRTIEVSKAIEKIQGGVNGRKESKNLNYIMNQMTADGQLLLTKLNGSNRHTFFALPEFFESLEKGNTILKQEHYPSPDSWGRLTQEERTFNNVKWISFIKEEI